MLSGFFLYLFISAYIFFALYYLLTKKYSQNYSFVDRILGTFVFAAAQIILSEIALGFSLKLVSLNLLLVNLVVSTVVLLLAGVSCNELLRQIREIRSSLAGFLALVIRHKVLMIICVLAFAQVLWWTFLVYLLPPYAWDAMTYHLPKVAHILQSNGIQEFNAGYIFVNVYPFNIELIFLWNVIYLGNDVLVDGTQVIFALLGVLAIYGIARKVGVKPQNAAFALIFLFVPIVIQQATTCYIDIAVSSLSVIAVNFLLLKDKPKINLIILGITIGILLGAKGSFILPSLLFSLIILLLILREMKAEKDTDGSRFVLFGERFLRDCCFYVIPILLLGGTWYIRDWILYGNPVAPVNVSLFGKTIFEGSRSLADISQNTPTFTDPQAIISSWLERSSPGVKWNHAYYNYDVGRGGFGPMFPILLLPSIVFSIFIGIKKGWRSYLVIAAVFILAFLVIPMNWWSRFTIFFCAFGVLAFTVMMEHLPKTKLVSLIAVPVIVFTMVAGNANPYYSAEKFVDLFHIPLTERRSTDFCVNCGNYTGLFQKMSEKSEITILFTDVPNRHSYLLWDSNFTNTVERIPEYYASYGEFIDYIEEFGKCEILTTDDSDIAVYCDADEPGLEPVYQIENWRLISYDGEDNVQED